MLYTIKSISDDGVYYLVNDWYSHGTFLGKRVRIEEINAFQKSARRKNKSYETVKTF